MADFLSTFAFCGGAESLSHLYDWAGSLLHMHGRALSSALVFAELDHHYLDMTGLDHFCFLSLNLITFAPLPASLFTFAFRV